MAKDYTFGASPEHLRRLLFAGLDEAESDKDAGSMASPTASAEGPGTKIGRYRLLEMIGEGGMGVVYRAEQAEPVRREVALKIIKPGMDSRRVLARFEAEQQALALMEHPHIARVYDAGLAPSGRPYFVMEHVKGIPITEHCDEYRLTIDERLRLFLHVCEAVQHAHQKGIIHRDLKPSNILVVIEDEQMIPKVIDFGVARAISQPLTRRKLFTEQGQLIGTPAYMSPEQADMANEDIDVRSDVYSLGVLLYVLVTGVLPFDAKTLREGGLEHIRHIIRDQEPQTPATRLSGLGEEAKVVALNRRTDLKTLARDLHKELEWIPLRAMRKERQNRYQSAAELGQDIRNYLDGAALIAGPPSRSYRIKKFVKRNRTLVSASVIVGLTIAIGSIVSLAMYVRAEVQAEYSQAIRSFMNDTVLRALDPYREQGGETTVLSVLDAVSDSLEGRFKDAPLFEAEVRHRLGLNYLRNDAYRRWERHLRRAVEIRRRELGDDDPMTIASMFELGSGLSDQGYCGDAHPLLLGAVAGRTRLLGEEDSQTLYAKTHLALNHWYLGQTSVAMRLFQEVLNTARRVGGDENSDAILAMSYIGILCGEQDDYDEAEKWLGKALQLSRRVKAEDHAWTCLFTGWLGWAYMLQGHYDKAETLLTEATRHEEQVFGVGHWQTVQHMQFLIQVYAAGGRLEEAAQWRAKLVAARPVNTGALSGSILYDEKADTYTIRGSGMDIWDIFDEFHFARRTLQGDGSIAARIDSLENTNPWAKCGVMIRKTLEPTSENASVFITPTGIVTFQRRGTPRGVTSHCAKQVGLPHWVRLTRRANTFTAEHSGDGVTWEEVRSPDPNDYKPAEITMDETVYIGLALTSHDAGRAAEAQISHVTSTGNTNPAGPFTASEDIGLQTVQSPDSMGRPMAAADVKDSRTLVQSDTNRLQYIDGELSPDDIEALATRHGSSVGSINYEQASGTYTIIGSGTDIWGESDRFHFAWKRLDGDGSIMARIDSVEQTHPWAKAGIMIRNTLDADSARADVIVTPTKRISFQYRTVAGADSSSTKTEEVAVTLPHWVKLTREGDLFTAKHSSDGKKWRDIEGDVSGSATSIRIAMNKTVYIGLAVTSHAGPFVPAEAKISNVAVTGDVQPTGGFLWSEDIGFQAVALPKK